MSTQLIEYLPLKGSQRILGFVVFLFFFLNKVLEIVETEIILPSRRQTETGQYVGANDTSGINMLSIYEEGLKVSGRGGSWDEAGV